MNPPSSAPAASHMPQQRRPSRSSGPSSHRAFISVELPFTLPPTITYTAAMTTTPDKERQESDTMDANARAIAAFLPPSCVAECVHRAVVQRRTGAPAEPLAPSDTGRNARGGWRAADADERDDADAEEDDDAQSRSSSDVASTSSTEDREGDSGGSDEDRGTGAAPGGAVGDGQPKARRRGLRLLTRHHRDYCTEPIFSTRRSTNWDDSDDELITTASARADTASVSYAAERSGKHPRDTSTTTTTDAAAQRRRRLELFPSGEPQLTVNGYYRNDLLLQVQRRRRVRRLRDAETNAILSEEFLGDADEGSARCAADSPATGANAASSCALTATVVGVVSRELELACPADFTFTPFTPDQLQAAPSLCGAEFFPPAHFLPPKALWEVRYEPGKEANTSATHDGAVVPSAFTAMIPGEAAGEAVTSDPVAPPESQVEFGMLPLVTVDPEETATLPAQLPEHRYFLEMLSSSADGSRDDDPAEVQLVVRLLADRPAWGVRDLADAMLQSGICPRSYRNKQVMNCFTYVIRTGPFNRLRLRFGYDPYASPRGVLYQRIAIQLKRRSEVGVRLRDVSRSPVVEDALRLLLERDRPRRTAYKAGAEQERRSTLLELQCRAIRDGMLTLSFQLIDVMDDAVVEQVVQAALTTDGPAAEAMAVPLRGLRHGWLSSAAYTRVTAHYAESLSALLKDEVEPLLRKFKGEPSQGPSQPAAKGDDGDGKRVSTAALRRPSASDDDSDEEDDGDLSMSSAMSSATAGDLSDDAEEEED